MATGNESPPSLAPNQQDSEAANRQEAVELQRSRPQWERGLWLVGGVFFVAVGAVGIIVPGLPTTPLLLLAAACFARSSPRLYAWLLRNKTFGPLIDDYRAGRGVSMRVKVSAISVMTIFVTFAVLMPLRDRPWVAALVATLALVGAAYIIRLPTRER